MSQKIVGSKAAFGQDFTDMNIQIKLIYLKKESFLVLLLLHFIANKIKVCICNLLSKCKNLLHLWN